MSAPAGSFKRTPEEAWALVLQYERLIQGQANRWPILEREDHAQELRLAVYRAALTFESEKCKDFSRWARGYMKACSARQPLTVVDTSYHLASQQQFRQKPGHIPHTRQIKSTSEKLNNHGDGTYEDLLTSSTPSPEEAISEQRESARFRCFILRRVDPGAARTGVAHYLDSGGECITKSAKEANISRQRLSVLYNRALRDWQARSRA